MKTIHKNTLHFLPGKPSPMGCSSTENGFNFAVFSDHTDFLSLILYTNNSQNPIISVPLDSRINRSGEVWHIEISGLPEVFEYGYRLINENDNLHSGKNFSTQTALNDPYARAHSGGEIWGKRNNDKYTANTYRSLFIEKHLNGKVTNH